MLACLLRGIHGLHTTLGGKVHYTKQRISEVNILQNIDIFYFAVGYFLRCGYVGAIIDEIKIHFEFTARHHSIQLKLSIPFIVPLSKKSEA
jgi:hypothetical protein